MVLTPIILHIPHSSTAIPKNIRNTLLLTDEELEQELLHFTDTYTDQLFTSPKSDFSLPLIYPVSRLVVDPERFPEDKEEPMVKHGLGAIHTCTQDGRLLRNPPGQEEREKLLNTFYRPHHRVLTSVVKDRLENTGTCLIIDCHSFPSLPFPFEEHKEMARPDICIGTDDYHTPGDLKDLAAGLFRDCGYTVGFNHPFSGTLVPLFYYRKNPSVFSLMIEVNKKCYMNEQTGEKIPGFSVLQKNLEIILRKLNTSYSP